MHREKDRLEAKYREQMDTLADRAGDLDTENRQLRGLKYELDTKVQCFAQDAALLLAL